MKHFFSGQRATLMPIIVSLDFVSKTSAASSAIYESTKRPNLRTDIENN